MPDTSEYDVNAMADEIERLRAENESLRADIRQKYARIDAWDNTCYELRTENDRYREALRQYANTTNWTTRIGDFGMICAWTPYPACDGWSPAHEALNGEVNNG